MKNGQPILSVFDGYDKTVVIPIYQRKYAWTQTQCERLFDDLEELVKSKNPTHFFGAVVGKAEDSFSWQVIDGQQRLTTVSVLLLALVHAIEAGEIECTNNRLTKKILNNYLITDPNETQELRLRPVDDDREAYERLFQPTSQLIESKNVTANYHYFRQRLRATTLTAEELFEDGISQIVYKALNDAEKPAGCRNSLRMCAKRMERTEVFVHWVRGHRGNVLNELANDVAMYTRRNDCWGLVDTQKEMLERSKAELKGVLAGRELGDFVPAARGEDAWTAAGYAA